MCGGGGTALPLFVSLLSVSTLNKLVSSLCSSLLLGYLFRTGGWTLLVMLPEGEL